MEEMQTDLRAVWADQQELCGPVGQFQRRDVEIADYSKSSPRSIAFAECVSAPMEIQSTPVSAIARTEDSVTPPDASTIARPSIISTASFIFAVDMLSSRMMS